jgi:redox-sensitive bicupin YhaK (pirin superfamily)
MMEDRYGPGVFGPHPHRGIETFTYVLGGEIEHFDNHRNEARVGAGDALLLTAGRGIVHDERPINGPDAHIFQLWINLPRADKMVDARLQALRASELPVFRSSGVEARVFSGEAAGMVAPTLNHAPFGVVELRMEEGAAFEHAIPAGHNAFLVVIEGALVAGAADSRVNAGQIAWLDLEETPSVVRVASTAPHSRLLIVAGRPLREPVSSRGPFVMNTDAEIERAYADFRTQQLGFGA